MDKAPNKLISVVYQLYTVTDGEKTLLEQTSTDHPFEFITGFGIALDAFEQQLMKLEKGTAFDFTLQPGEAFGDYIPEGVHKLGRELFTVNGRFDSENIYPEAIIRMNDAEDHQFMARVVKVEADGVTIDTNHPLAGKTLNFTGTLLENRDATDEEVKKTIKMLTGGCSGCGGHCGDGHCSDGGCGDCH